MGLKGDFCKKGHVSANNTAPNGKCRICDRERAKEKRRLQSLGLWVPQRYLGSKFCPNDHARTPENLYSSGGCRICIRTAALRRYKQNPQPALDRAIKWAEDNKEKANQNKMKWAENNPQKVLDAVRQYRYSLPPEDFQRMFEEQEGKCPICERDFGDDLKVCIDHDHSCCAGYTSCGKCVRGLLCDECNRGLGAFRDEKERLLNAAAYLDNHKSTIFTHVG
jgi:hypothetical protein